jgi:ketosteroid isomerase-like protein
MDVAQDDAVAHLEVVQRGWKAFNSRDFAGAVQYFHPDGDAFLPSGRRDPSAPADARRLHGRDEVRRFLEEFSSAWPRITVDLKEVLAGLDGRLLGVEGWQIQGQGIEVATKTVTVYAFRDGLVARLDRFADKAKALEGLGTKK